MASHTSITDLLDMEVVMLYEIRSIMIELLDKEKQ